MVKKDLLVLLLAQVFTVTVCWTCPTNNFSCNISSACLGNHVSDISNLTSFFVFVNSSIPNIQEGDNVTLKCHHNLPDFNFSYSWIYNCKQREGHKKELVLGKVLGDKKGQYLCIVESTCGSCWSSPYTLSFDTSGVVLIIICGVCALALVVIMGVVMKVKLKRDNAQHKERMRQRAQAEQNTNTIAYPRRGY